MGLSLKEARAHYLLEPMGRNQEPASDLAIARRRIVERSPGCGSTSIGETDLIVARFLASLYRRDVGSKETFDISFNFSSDTPDGKDMDAHSPTLRRYHKLLWSKPLPSGAPFDLTYSGSYLRHASELGEFELASDQAVHTFSKWKKTKHIIDQIPAEETADFVDKASTIGAMMIFPGNKVDGKMTINGSRGFNYYIGDRLDLTLECIRRHYLAEASPLSETLARYSDFFGLFGDFAGYTDFFLLQDLVDDAGPTVKFYLPFDDFAGSPIPNDLDAYIAYREKVLGFVAARGERMVKEVAAK